MFLLTRKYRPLLGLDITTSSVKLIELSSAGSNSFRVEAYAAEPTPVNSMNEKAIVDAEAVGEAIRRAAKRAGTKLKDVAIAISGDAAITKVIQMPKNLRGADLEQQVEIQADQYIPFPMDEVSYDFEVLGPSEKDAETIDVLLVATRTENVEQRQAAVAAAGLTAKIVDVEAFALENACRLMVHQMPEGGIERTVAVVDSVRAARRSACCATSRSSTHATSTSAGSSSPKRSCAPTASRWKKPGARRKKAGCRATTRPRCSTRSSTT